MNERPYVCFFKEKRVEVCATSSYSAQVAAEKLLKVSEKNPMNLKDFYNEIDYLCMKYNHYTKPYVLRTDHQHHRARTIARECLRRIESKYRYGIDYRELNNGALLPYYSS